MVAFTLVQTFFAKLCVIFIAFSFEEVVPIGSEDEVRFFVVRVAVLSFGVFGVVSLFFAVKVAPAEARRLELPMIVALLVDVAVAFGIGGNSRTNERVYRLNFTSAGS